MRGSEDGLSPSSDGQTSEDIYRVLPPDADAVPHEPPILPQVVPEDDPEPEEESWRGFLQFTLRDMLLVMTGLAVWFSIMFTIRWTWSIAAGLSALAALVGMLVLTVHEPESPNARRVCWGLIVLYFLTCVSSLFQPLLP
jgi:hypothetical protein